MNQGYWYKGGFPPLARRQLTVSCAEPLPALGLSIRVTPCKRDELRTPGLEQRAIEQLRFMLSRGTPSVSRCRGTAKNRITLQIAVGVVGSIAAPYLEVHRDFRQFAQTEAAIAAVHLPQPDETVVKSFKL